jgi:drug/metabolite transporter (DMT)-like permease
VFLGFLITQANLCFAVGQVAYKYLLKSTPELESTPKYTFGFFLLVRVLVALIAFFILAQQKRCQLHQFSGDINIPGCCGFRCRLFFWNKGVTKVNTGSLAIMNNALIPVGLIVNLVIWNKEADIKKILIMVVVLFSLLLRLMNT